VFAAAVVKFAEEEGLAVGHVAAVPWGVQVLCLAVPSEAGDGTAAAVDQY
jgi:hypothetical protein